MPVLVRILLGHGVHGARSASRLKSTSVVVALTTILFEIGAPNDARAEGNQGIFHKTLENETYDDLALRYYGNRFFARHLMLFNRRPEPIPQGTLIIIPSYRMYPVERGQTLDGFARRYLNDPGRAEYLAELHGLAGRERKVPNPGRRIRAVPSLRHVVRRGESLESIARYYYRDASPKRLQLITLYNRISNPKAKLPTTLRIPLDQEVFSHGSVLERSRLPPREAKTAVAESSSPDKEREKEKAQSTAANARRKRFTQTAATPEPEASSKADSKPLAPSSASVSVTPAQIEEVEKHYSDGEYERAKSSAQRLLSIESLPLEERLELLRTVAFSEVALGDLASSESTFRQILRLDPEYELDLYRTSPKILNVFHQIALR